MDEGLTKNISLTGTGHIILGMTDEIADPLPYLEVKKNRKFMAMQDCLAVVAAGRALANIPTISPERTGLFVAVGYLPFEEEEINLLVDNSQVEETFSIRKFATDGLASVNPLLTFRCLPNMPLFHVSANFNIQGGYFATYGGTFQFYLALREALHALQEKRIDRAVVGGVAHQNNFLVQHHLSKMGVDTSELKDAAGFIVLERREAADALSIDRLQYSAYDPLSSLLQERHRFSLEEITGLGAATLPVMLSHYQTEIGHCLYASEECIAASRWKP